MCYQWICFRWKDYFFDLSMSHCNKWYRSEEISPQDCILWLWKLVNRLEKYLELYLYIHIFKKHRKNCEIALTPGIPSSPGIPGLWSLAEIVKFGRNCEIWSKLLNLFNIVKLWNSARIVKIRQNCEIWPYLQVCQVIKVILVFQFCPYLSCFALVCPVDLSRSVLLVW